MLSALLKALHFMDHPRSLNAINRCMHACLGQFQEITLLQNWAQNRCKFKYIIYQKMHTGLVT